MRRQQCHTHAHHLRATTHECTCLPSLLVGTNDEWVLYDKRRNLKLFIVTQQQTTFCGMRKTSSENETQEVEWRLLFLVWRFWHWSRGCCSGEGIGADCTFRTFRVSSLFWVYWSFQRYSTPSKDGADQSLHHRSAWKHKRKYITCITRDQFTADALFHIR